MGNFCEKVANGTDNNPVFIQIQYFHMLPQAELSNKKIALIMCDEGLNPSKQCIHDRNLTIFLLRIAKIEQAFNSSLI